MILNQTQPTKAIDEMLVSEFTHFPPVGKCFSEE